MQKTKFKISHLLIGILLATLMVTCGLLVYQHRAFQRRVLLNNLRQIDLRPYSDAGHRQRCIELAENLYRKNGEFWPRYALYHPSKTEYSQGFHDAMTLAIEMEDQSIDIKDRIAEIATESSGYIEGFYSGLEAYSAISSTESGFMIV